MAGALWRHRGAGEQSGSRLPSEDVPEPLDPAMPEAFCSWNFLSYKPEVLSQGERDSRTRSQESWLLLSVLCSIWQSCHLLVMTRRLLGEQGAKEGVIKATSSERES